MQEALTELALLMIGVVVLSVVLSVWVSSFSRDRLSTQMLPDEILACANAIWSGALIEDAHYDARHGFIVDMRGEFGVRRNLRVVRTNDTLLAGCMIPIRCGMS